MKKILIIRLSSIGDIVLTTPVIRCIKQQLNDVELHYVVKKSFFGVIQNNPYIDKIHIFDKDLNKTIEDLKKENFDYVIDLHNNLRSFIIKSKLKKPSSSFNKLNLKKYLLVTFKINLLPDIHIVDRYINTAKSLNIKNDNKGLEYYIKEEDNIDKNSLPEKFRNGFIGFVIGGKHATKCLPNEKIINICKEIQIPVILLGGKEDKINGDIIANNIGEKVYNACGIYNLNQSASIVRQAKLIITNDTGLMHISAAFHKEIISVWGNTIPELGMYQYLPEKAKSELNIFEIKGLKCRPCSKIGYEKCPKKHFNCMNKINEKLIIEKIKKLL